MSDTKVRPTSIANDFASGEESDMGRIRDIIFSNQMRDYERRFGELFSQLEADTNRIVTLALPLLFSSTVEIPLPHSTIQ